MFAETDSSDRLQDFSSKGNLRGKMVTRNFNNMVSKTDFKDDKLDALIISCKRTQTKTQYRINTSLIPSSCMVLVREIMLSLPDKTT